MQKIKLLKTIKIKNILACIFLLLFNLSFTGANAACLQLCSENWWLNTSKEEIKSEILKVKNLNMRDDYGFRPLHFAVQNGEKDKVNLLLKVVSTQMQRQITVLHQSILQLEKMVTLKYSKC